MEPDARDDAGDDACDGRHFGLERELSIAPSRITFWIEFNRKTAKLRDDVEIVLPHARSYERASGT